MKELSIAEILFATNGTLLSGNTDTLVSSVVCDSRKAHSGALFVPLLGDNVDGHEFIGDAFNSGAAASFVKTGYQLKIEGKIGALIEVDDTLKAMQYLAKYYRKKFTLPIIGVTGSVGKTTTKEMIAAALGSVMKVFKTSGNYNGQIGVPLTIFELNDTYEIAIIEMGVSKIGEMEKLADIVNPDIGVITNIGVSHLENFKTVENICDEKLKIMKNQNGILYLNGDSPILAKKGENSKCTVVYFGINGDYTYKCQDIYFGGYMTEFTLITSKFRENVSIPCLGIHNVYNALAAIGIASHLGKHIEDIKNGLKSFKNIGMRQQILSLNKGITVIDDSYNASPDSMKSAVNVLKSVDAGRKIVVMADMLELGENSAQFHYDIGRYIAIENIEILIAIGQQAKNVIDGASSVNQKTKSYSCANNHEALEILRNIIENNDSILVKGSRSMHTEEVVKKLENWFC